MKPHTVYGIYVVLISLLLISVGIAYWGLVYSIYRGYVGHIEVPPLADKVVLAVFWTGVGLFALGIVMVLAGVVVDAMEMKARYTELKKLKA